MQCQFEWRVYCASRRVRLFVSVSRRVANGRPAFGRDSPPLPLLISAAAARFPTTRGAADAAAAVATTAAVEADTDAAAAVALSRSSVAAPAAVPSLVDGSASKFRSSMLMSRRAILGASVAADRASASPDCIAAPMATALGARSRLPLLASCRAARNRRHTSKRLAPDETTEKSHTHTHTHTHTHKEGEEGRRCEAQKGRVNSTWIE